MCASKTVVIGVLLLMAVGFLGCSSDPPSKSNNSPKDYVVYGWNYGEVKNFVGYHSLTGAIDSLTLPIPYSSGMKASPDGRRLYIARPDRVSVLELSSRQIIMDLPYASVEQILFSPDGRVIALFPGGLTLLRVSDYSILYRHTAGTYAGAFSADSRLFYCRYGLGLACVSIDSASILWQRDIRFQLGTSTLISKDNSRLFNLWEGWLRAYDIGGDSLLFDHRFGYSDGDMVSSLDGTRLYLTAAGNIDISPAPFTFAVYDIQNNRMLDSARVPVVATERCPSLEYVSGGYLAMTPDGYLFASEAPVRGAAGLALYDSARPDTAKWICTRLAWMYLTCQTNP